MKKDSNKIVEYVFAVAFMVIGLFAFLVGRTYRGNDKYFPMIVGVLTLLAAIWIFIEDIKSKESCFNLSKVNLLAVGVACIAMLIYYFLFQSVGYIISTFFLGVAVLAGMRFKNKLGTILYPALIVIILFVVFKVLLKIPLPTIFLYK